MNPLRYNNLILPARSEAAAGRLKLHHAEIGARYVLVDKDNFPKTRIYSMVRTVKGLTSAKKHLEDHIHDVDSVMTFIGDDDDLSGLQIEVHLDDEIQVVESPFSVYVPGGLRHGYKFVKGSGKYVNLVLTEGGDYNAVTR